MEHERRDARTGLTDDLSVIVRRGGRSCVAACVLNLSEGGMLLGANDLSVGEMVGLELVGPGFSFACRAKVTHRTDGATGVQVVSWEGPASRVVGGLVAERRR